MTNYDITEKSVFSLGYESPLSDIWTNTGFQYDWAIAGRPFLSIASDEFQLVRSFVQVNKQQFDNRAEPGEQTLTGWWLRSQRDFSIGAGQEFYEPAYGQQVAGDERISRRYWTSRGVDVWTPGKVSLLPKMNLLFASTGDTEVVTASNGTTSFIYGLTGTGVSRSNGTTTTSITGWTATPTALASTGNSVLGFHSTGIDISAASGTTATSLWTHSLGAGDGWWVKERIIAAFGKDLYELNLDGGSITTSDKIFSPSGTGWTWVSACAAPGAILVAGYRGVQSAIYKFTLKTNGQADDGLAAPVTVAEFPTGEVIRDIKTYLGAYLLIVTSAGVRIGTVDAEGNVNYGPLTYTGNAQGHSFAYDRFFYVGVTDAGNGTSGCIRIDLSEIDPSGRAAWANDVDTGATGEIDAVTGFGTTDRIAIGVHGSGVYLASATELVSTGNLVSSRIRYSTLEPKTFQLASVKGETVNGSIQIFSIDTDNDETSLYTLSAASTAEFGLNPTDPNESLSLKFVLNRDPADATKGPTLRGWQTKALPAVLRKQQWRLPLLCFDSEQDRFGNRHGHTGDALQRYRTLRASLINGIPVLLQDLISGDSFTVLVEDVQFYQTSPPHNANGFGGVLIVQCREL